MPWYPDYYTYDFKKNSLWLQVKPRNFRPNIENQLAINGGSDVGPVYHFLIGKSFTTGLSHEWADITSISGAIRDVKAELGGAANKAFSALGAGNIYASGKSFKNDNPIVYQNSARRQFNIELQFAAKHNAQAEVWEPIFNLMKWSAASGPGKTQYSTQFDMPFVFSVQTVTGDGTAVPMVNFKNACIESITPNYSAPYKDGYPMHATCQVQWKDIDPTYRENIESSGATISVKVGSGGL